jgi:hypothetical protein
MSESEKKVPGPGDSPDDAITEAPAAQTPRKRVYTDFKHEEVKPTREYLSYPRHGSRTDAHRLFSHADANVDMSKVKIKLKMHFTCN